MSGKVQEMPQTKNTRFYPGSPNRCSRGLDREKYARGEKKSSRPAGVGYLIGDSSKTKQVFGGGHGLKKKHEYPSSSICTSCSNLEKILSMYDI
jgi:GDP-D-mannose dehydratase